MGTVTDRLVAWLSYEHTKWDLPREPLLAWAGAVGDDPIEAWEACPRGDHLVALAGALGLPFVYLVRPLCAVARDVLRLVPSRDHAARQLVTQCERWRPPKGPTPPKPESEAYRSVWKTVRSFDAPVEQEQLALKAAGTALGRGLGGVLTAHIDARIAWFAAQGPAEPEVPRDWCGDLIPNLERFLATDRAAALWLASLPGVRRTLGVGHAMRAVGSLGVAIASGDQAMNAAELGEALAQSKGVSAPEGLIPLIERGHQRVFTEGAMVFHHAARAIGRERSVARESVDAAIRTGLSILEASMRQDFATDAVKALNLHAVIEDALDAIDASADAIERRRQADALRAAIGVELVRDAAGRESVFWSPVGPSLACEMEALKRGG